MLFWQISHLSKTKLIRYYYFLTWFWVISITVTHHVSPVVYGMKIPCFILWGPRYATCLYVSINIFLWRYSISFFYKLLIQNLYTKKNFFDFTGFEPASVRQFSTTSQPTEIETAYHTNLSMPAKITKYFQI